MPKQRAQGNGPGRRRKSMEEMQAYTIGLTAARGGQIAPEVFAAAEAELRRETEEWERAVQARRDRGELPKRG